MPVSDHIILKKRLNPELLTFAYTFIAQIVDFRE